MASTGNITDYVERCLKTFEEQPLNELDSLVFSQLVYLRIGETFPDAASDAGRALKDLFQAEHLERLYGGMRDVPQNKRMIAALASSPRFRDVRVCCYVNEIEHDRDKQFCAVCFRLPHEAGSYVAFSGTDRTIAGWKEDFNLAVRYPVPSQLEAADFLKRCAGFPGALYVGGHSKGGNLAIYCAMTAQEAVSARIVRIFDHDGPGFSHQVIASDAFKAVLPRISKTVPQGSLVGLLFETVPTIQVVACNGIGGIMQHDPYLWQADIENARFVLKGKLDEAAARNDKVLDEWVASMDEEEGARFIDALFGVLSAGGATEFGLSAASVKPLDVVKGLLESGGGARSALTGNLAKLFGMLASAAVSSPFARADESSRSSNAETTPLGDARLSDRA